MGRGDQDRLRRQPLDPETAGVQRLAHDLQAPQPEALRLGVPAGVLHRDPAHARVGERVGEQVGPLSDPAQDDDARGVGRDAARAPEVIGQRLAQLEVRRVGSRS